MALYPLQRTEKVTFRNVPFSMLTPVPHEYESLSNEVRSVCEDKQGNLWVGLKDGMIRLYDSNRKFIGHLTGNGTISMTGTPMEGTAYFIMQDSKGLSGLLPKETVWCVPNRFLPQVCLIN